MENINAKNLADSIAAQCKQFEESQEYKDMITTAVKKLYTSALDDVFRWGDFPDRVKEAIKNAMPANVSDFVDLAKYNTLMINTLKQSWAESGIQNHSVKQIQELTLKSVADINIPKFVFMSELFEAFIDANADKSAEENWDKPSVLMRESDAVPEYWDIGFEAEPELNSRYSSSKTHGFQFENYLNIRAIYSDRKEKEFQLHEGHKCYELYAGKVDDEILGKEVIKPYSEYEKLICALYFGGATLVWDDCDPNDLYYPHGY
ncbi:MULTISPECIES: hypothetical protein [unclassified Acinetobacter]|uniref:hypothetical protein n=1 Tax=unclassified Acinetobacter TaxID=196816 RepID=UPI00211E55FF|nr:MULTISPECIES: hypothetical protein [unclassified Acinetobacter]